MKKYSFWIVILVLIAIGILACVLTKNIGTTETIGNQENEVNNSIETNSNTQNNVNENTTNSQDIEETDNNTNATETQVDSSVPVTNNQVYESDSDFATTDKKQEAINLVKDVWGEDSTVTFRCDSVTADGKYIIAVVSLESASVKNYFKVDLSTKQVDVDY